MRNVRFSKFLLFIILVYFTSCDHAGTKRQIRKTLLSFESVEVQLPQSVLEVNGKEIKTYNPRSDSRLKYVVYFAPYECSECAVAHLMEYKALFRMSEEYGSFLPVIVFSPDPDSVQGLVRKLVSSNFPFPIYIDQDQAMQNTAIPQDRLYHSFLLGRNEMPIYVGNPLGSEASEKLFKDAIRLETDKE